MLDFILGLYIAGLAVRGWLRGFVRELMDLIGLIIGAIVAFRLSEPFGGFLTDRFGVSPEWGRIGAGIVLFVLFGVAMTIVAHFLSKVANLPGLTLANRLLGTLVAAAWGVVLVLVVVTVVGVLPFPQAVQRTIDDSAVAQAIAGPTALPRRLLEPLVGDRTMTALATIQELTGGRRIVPAEGERIETRPVDRDEIVIERGRVAFIADRINADRLNAGVDPLARSQALDSLAEERAVAMYRQGFVARRRNERVLEQTRETPLRLDIAAEMAALAASDRAAQAAIAQAEGTALAGRDFDRVGVAVVSGPLGTMVVEVFGG
jgi:uncharacterized membrane protein required for colicin V production